MIASSSKNSFSSWKARCGLTGTSSKSVFRKSVERSLQGEPGVRDHSQVGLEDPSQLARVYVYVDELAIPPVDVEISCVPLGPAVADPHDEVALQEEGVGVALLGLETHDTGVQRMVLRDGALSHVGRGHRDLQVLRDIHELF